MTGQPPESDAERRARGPLTRAQWLKLCRETGPQVAVVEGTGGEIPGLRETRGIWIEQQVRIGGMDRAQATAYADRFAADSESEIRAGTRARPTPANGWR